MAYGNLTFQTDMLQKKIEEFKDTITELQSLCDKFASNIDTVLEPNWNTQGSKAVIKDLEEFNNEQLRSYVTMYLMKKLSDLEIALDNAIKIDNAG